MERDERKEGLVAARRCLEAMTGCDFETDLALWKAAKRYASKGRISEGDARDGRSLLARTGDGLGLVSRAAKP